MKYNLFHNKLKVLLRVDMYLYILYCYGFDTRFTADFSDVAFGGFNVVATAVW